jgi:SAM-dependent methyltransferase
MADRRAMREHHENRLKAHPLYQLGQEDLNLPDVVTFVGRVLPLFRSTVDTEHPVQVCSLPSMEYTGERMLPEASDSGTFWEHIYRYRFASGFCSGRDALDIACGEGYGTASLMAAGARSVLGVDISAEACAHAVRKYGVPTRQGSATEIPSEPCQFDVVVSFETIEHVADPEAFVSEARRVLRSGGHFVVSTPSRDTYREVTPNNPFHVSELAPAEFMNLLQKRFSKVELFGQKPRRAEGWSALQLVAEVSPLKRIRGAGRLLGILQKAFCGEIVGSVDAVCRTNPVQLVLSNTASACPWVNPFAVVPIRKYSGAAPTYLVAVCQV